MSEINTNELREMGARCDYLADIEVLKAAGIDYLGWLKPEDMPLDYSQSRLSASANAVEEFWESSISPDSAAADRYNNSIKARIKFIDYVSELVGTVAGYRLGNISEDEIALYGAFDASSTDVDVVLELELLGRAANPEPIKFREIAGALGTAGCLKCPLETTEKDLAVLLEIGGRIGNVLSRMSPDDTSLTARECS